MFCFNVRAVLPPFSYLLFSSWSSSQIKLVKSPSPLLFVSEELFIKTTFGKYSASVNLLPVDLLPISHHYMSSSGLCSIYISVIFPYHSVEFTSALNAFWSNALALPTKWNIKPSLPFGLWYPPAVSNSLNTLRYSELVPSSNSCKWTIYRE